jgi:hypothetical protein
MTMIRKTYLTLAVVLGAAVILQQPAGAATGTLAPDPYLTVFDSSGNPVSGACIWTYTAGTSTPVATYTSKAITTPNSNPIVADASGQYVAYLVPGTSYKFTFETACTAPAHGTVLRTQDGIDATPASSGAIDITGTAGENITAGQCVYLSDGSGAKSAGQWFKCDTGNPYSSSLPEVGLATATITSGNSGAIRLAGQLTGLSSLTIGAEYYVGASGALTSTAPANRRHLGHADSATSIVLSSDPAQIAVPYLNQFRLSLTSGSCVTTSDVTAATTLYWTPCYGNQITLYDANGAAAIYASAEISIAIPATTSTLYDVWVYNNAGTLTLELLAWTNDSTRATAIARTGGRWTKTGDATRLYVGNIRTTTVAGQTEDSGAKRYLWNAYNRLDRVLQKFEGSSSWAYTTATIRQANASATNQVEAVVGLAEDEIEVQIATMVINTVTAAVQICVGVDSTTTCSASNQGGYMREASGSGTFSIPIAAWYRAVPAIGKRTYSWNEYSEAAGATTWNSNTSSGSTPNSGLQGRLKG